MSEDPRTWQQEDVDQFCTDADAAAVADLINTLVTQADDVALEVLGRFLQSRHEDLFLKGVPSQMAVLGLLGLGPQGVEFLAERLLNARVRYRANVLHMLWLVSRGEDPSSAAPTMLSSLVGAYLPSAYPPETVEAATRAVRDIFAEGTTSTVAFELIASFMQQVANKEFLVSDAGSSAPSVMELFAEASIRLSPSVLDEFEQLIVGEEGEKRYQQFLAANPVLLDPLAAEVVPKQKLGVEFATDYAVRRHDGRWVLVEIEKPQDQLFTQRDDFRSEFTHAFGQVVDFNHWVDANVAYAQKLMPDIASPRGLLVMGRRNGLTQRQAEKLRAFVSNSQRIEVVTFDDLLAGGRNLYSSLRHARA